MKARTTGRRDERRARIAATWQEPLHVLVATADAALGERVRRNLMRPDVDVDVIASPGQVLLAMDARYEAGGREGPDLVVLDDRMCALGSLLLLVERVVDSSALVLCVGDDGPLHPTCGGPLGALAVLDRPLRWGALRSAVAAFARSRMGIGLAREHAAHSIRLDSEALDEEPATERSPMFFFDGHAGESQG